MLKGRKLEDLVLEPASMPNLLFVHRDKAHASRRLTSRGWSADPYLQSVHESIVGRGCFVQRIQNSQILQKLFNNFARSANVKNVNASRVQDLGACKPRLEISQKPYVRRTLHYEAHIATAVAVSRGRHGKAEGAAAQQFLRGFSGSSPSFLLGDRRDHT